MPNFGVTVAVIDSGQVLLTRREDFRVWCLPGGAVDSGESVAEAAVREVREETGLVVQLTRLVGIYSRPTFPPEGSHEVLFSAVPVGGSLQPAQGESLDVRFFDPSDLPDLLFWWHRRQIRDALSGVGGSVAVCQYATWPFPKATTRAQAYDLLQRGAVPLEQFQAYVCKMPQSNDELLEVPVDSSR
jgi:ADP-ribose pyrophosphatase YjhB (NUDIX family)